MRPERDVWLLVAMSLPVSISIGVRMVILMPYLEMVGFSKAEIGAIGMAGTLAMAVLSVPMGMLADLRGRKALIMSGRALVALSDLMYFYLRDFYGLLAASFVGGLGASMTGSVRTALLADKAPSEEARRRVFTVSQAFFSVGSVLGSLLAGLPDLLAAWRGMPQAEGTRLIFILCSIFATTSFILLIPVREPEIERPGRATITVRSWDVVWSYGLFEALLGLGGGLVLPWFSWYFFVKFGVLLSEIGVLFAVTQGLLALGNFMASGMASRIGSVRTAAACQLASVAVLLAIPLSPSFAIASCFYVARAVLMNMAFPALRAFYMGLLRREERASVNAIQNTVFWGTRSLGTYGSSALMELFSLDAPFFACAALYSIATLWLYACFKSREATGP
ncbi:hypothetical protein DRO60_06105 [Candidatus Bathyarchaeota archaeon]|nr:MAG: hypothetical protein DRO60_06105 [Candidatus Bathyarchaeota archaeon]